MLYCIVQLAETLQLFFYWRQSLTVSKRFFFFFFSVFPPLLCFNGGNRSARPSNSSGGGGGGLLQLRFLYPFPPSSPPTDSILLLDPYSSVNLWRHHNIIIFFIFLPLLPFCYCHNTISSLCSTLLFAHRCKKESKKGRGVSRKRNQRFSLMQQPTTTTVA